MSSYKELYKSTKQVYQNHKMKYQEGGSDIPFPTSFISMGPSAPRRAPRRAPVRSIPYIIDLEMKLTDEYESWIEICMDLRESLDKYPSRKKDIEAIIIINKTTYQNCIDSSTRIYPTRGENIVKTLVEEVNEELIKYQGSRGLRSNFTTLHKTPSSKTRDNNHLIGLARSVYWDIHLNSSNLRILRSIGEDKIQKLENQRVKYDKVKQELINKFDNESAEIIERVEILTMNEVFSIPE